MTEPLPLFGDNAPRKTIYLMTDLRWLKIGYTTRTPRRRGGELRAFDLYSFPGDQADERRLHERFEQYRVPGTEWFHPCGDLLLWAIANVCREGNPRAMALLWETIRTYYAPVEDTRAA